MSVQLTIMPKTAKQKIAMVDDNAANLTIGRAMLKEHYEVYPIQSGARLFEFLGKVMPDLILLDIMMPEMDGYEVIRRLKADGRYERIPVIFLSAKSDGDSELTGLSLGAVDYVMKPFSAPLLLKRIENHLLISQQSVQLQRFNENLMMEVNRKTEQLVGMRDTVLAAINEMVEFRDGNTGNHIGRTQQYLKWLVDELARQGIYSEIISGWDMDLLLSSAPLHDAGKIAISDAILNKPGKLTDAEFAIMKQHVNFGIELIERIEKTSGSYNHFLKYAKVIIGAHHEKYDGSGYPLGLSGNDIPLEGRLMALADVYDALTSERPYKKAFSPDEAVKIIHEGSGNHFDPLLVGVFNNIFGLFRDMAMEEMHAAAA